MIPYIGFVLIVGLAYARFLFELPAKTRNLFLIAATLYVEGALGIEMVGGYYSSQMGGKDVVLAL